MGISVGILGMSGDGKTTSAIINPDGTYNPNDYKGMNPESHYIVNLDRKALPFPGGIWCAEKKNYKEISNFEDLRNLFKALAAAPHIKSVQIDTLNVFLSYKEYNDRKKLTFDQWRDIANDVIELLDLCNNVLRPDQIAYIMGHVELQTDVNGEEKKVFSVIGKKSKKTQPEGFFPICLFSGVEYGDNGENKHTFETKARRTTAKTPIGMFKDFSIPNSLSLVDKTIRDYYKI